MLQNCSMHKRYLLPFCLAAALTACKKDDVKDNSPKEDAATFREIGSIDIGDEGAAEIAAYDPKTQCLFVVNNGVENKIDVLDFRNPSAPVAIGSISMYPVGGLVNSLDVENGVLAAAVESVNKQAPGKVALYNTSDYSLIKTIEVGALPDMITYSPDGKFILTANEGEPSADYTNDPEGTVSLISVKENYAVTTIRFDAFAAQQASLVAKGLRIFGPGSSFTQDLEPEYITVSSDNRTAWVTLQENNAIARIDLQAKAVTSIMPLGFKSYNTDGNGVNLSDKDNKDIALSRQQVFGIYQPDAIGYYTVDGQHLLFTANEGDAREYNAFKEAKRVKDLLLDGAAFPDATVKTDARLGRLNITTTLGDTDKDGDFDALYSFGARSFSVWNGTTGVQVYDSGNELDQRTIAAGVYDDDRSDDKSVEPEGLTIGNVGKEPIVFVGLERADAVGVYNISNPYAPRFLTLLKTGDAPEGVLFIDAKDSPTKKSLLVVSSEGDGVIKIYSPE